jgi:hypothetical protein
VRILFVMRHGGYVRNFEWVLRLLADRSHRVQIGFERGRVQGMAERIERGRADFPLPEQLRHDTKDLVSYGVVPTRDDQWRSVAFGLRQSVSYLRYLSPAYRRAAKLRKRWARGTPRLTVRLASLPGIGSRLGIAALQKVLRAAERLVPRSKEIDEHLRTGGFDLLVITPLVDGPTQHDWLRSARALGVPAVLAVASWDNLTNKGVMFDHPTRTYVWNEIQRREAVDLHGLDPDSVVAVGAYPFDHWFEWRPSTTRADFCAEAGLDPAAPFLLYVCSSGFIASDERPIVARWLEGVRSDPQLSGVGILVRPHPTNGAIWSDHALSALPNVAVWPRVGADPTDEERRAGFYDSMYHSLAVVGANTTALIDAAIVGRRTFSVLLPELRGGQEETLHFHYLRPESGGALTVAGSLEEHIHQLRDAAQSDPSDDHWRREFLESFVRPHGLEQAAATRFVDDLERLADKVSDPRAELQPADSGLESSR